MQIISTKNRCRSRDITITLVLLSAIFIDRLLDKCCPANFHIPLCFVVVVAKIENCNRWMKIKKKNIILRIIIFRARSICFFSFVLFGLNCFYFAFVCLSGFLLRLTRIRLNPVRTESAVKNWMHKTSYRILRIPTDVVECILDE